MINLWITQQEANTDYSKTTWYIDSIINISELELNNIMLVMTGHRY